MFIFVCLVLTLFLYCFPTPLSADVDVLLKKFEIFRNEDYCVQKNAISKLMDNIRSLDTDLEKYEFLMNLSELNPDLFYATALSNTEELIPLIYTPTVGEACLEYSSIFPRLASSKGLFLTMEKDKGMVYEILKKSQEIDPSIIVVTDGSRILGLGDLGANGMGISVGKLQLYVLGGGFNHEKTLPVVLDVGTNNEDLLNSEDYIGSNVPRDRENRFWEFLEEFVVAVNKLWPQCLVQFEDFSNDVSFDMLEMYRKKILSFNDDIQGTGAVILSGFINAVKLSKVDFGNHRMLFFGAGSAAIGVADQIKMFLKNYHGISDEDAKKMFYMVDSKGLLDSSREKEKLAAHKIPYWREDITIPKPTDSNFLSLIDIVRFVKPTCIIGLSKQQGAFSDVIIQEMLNYSSRPIVMALSNPTSKSECSSIDVYENTDGMGIFLSGSKFPSWLNPKTQKMVYPGQGNNMYIFPGLGLGAYLSQPVEISDEILLESSIALAEMTNQEQLDSGNVYPKLENIRSISIRIAEKIFDQVVRNGLSKIHSKDTTFEEAFDEMMGR